MQLNPFAGEASDYARLRPTYPLALFRYLSTTVSPTNCAWDCATGNGQAAVCLADSFERVVATDESREMLAQAPWHPNVTYRVAEAEESGLETRSVDLVTVAAAIHWFDLNRFYEEVGRVVRPGGVIAAWTYYTPVFGNAIDGVIRHLAHDILGGYWDERLHYAVEAFHTLPFPFEPVDRAPSFETKMEWRMEDLLDYFDTWSASLKYYKEEGFRPTNLIKKDLAAAWGPDDQRRVLHFPLYMRIGRV